LQIFSQFCINGIRALLYLASHNKSEGYTNIKQMAKALDISFHFLTKVLQPLTQKGILNSYRGPNGGVSLAVKNEDIRLIDIVLIYEGDSFFTSCLLGMPGCGEQKPCPVHEFWKHTKEDLKRELCKTTLVDLGNDIRSGKVRLINKN
jgi:Rrf2 family transcriptional regulator, iron-sulfur cluster assembly transcription factor